MNALRNKVQLIGNMGKDPEIRITESGKTMAKFSLATNETYRSSTGEKVTETQWHNIIAWGKIAELAGQILSKGKEVAIEGKLMNSVYTDKNGVKKYFTQVQANQLLLTGGKQEQEKTEEQVPANH